MNITPKSFPLSIDKRVRPVIIFFIGVLLTILFIQIPLFSGARERIQFVATSIGTGFGNVWNRVFASGESINAQKDHYQSLSESLSSQIALLEDESTRVKELETLLGYQESTQQSTTTVKIIARAPDGKQTLLIDKGTVDGLTNNMPVVAEGGHMVGSILEARKKTSVVRLLADQSSSVPATVLGETKTIGLVEGEEGFLLHMQFIPQDEGIETGNVVVTSGLDAYTPENLVLGTVAEVIKNESSPFQEARIEPLIDLRSLSYLLVIDGIEEL